MDIAIAAPGRLSTADMLARLVAFDTTSRNSNLDLIGFVRDYLGAHGVASRLTHDADGRKANLHAVVGPDVPGGIALSGHVDTVPVEGQAWTGDPFALREAGGRLMARGSCDMKGFVASALAAVPDLLARGLARPVHLFITYDEETTCDGARRLVADLVETGRAPAMCVVGEPTLMRPVLAQKGRLALRVTARGVPGHSSQPARGVNAIYAAARAIMMVAEDAHHLATEGPFEDGFDPPYTTAHVGTVEGGSILNIIPERASFVMEWRTLPGEDAHARFNRLRARIAAEIEPAMRAADPSCGFDYDEFSDLPPLSADANSPIAIGVTQATGANALEKVSYGTEAGIYQAAGISTVICGPGDIAQAHRPDEWVARDQLDACDQFIRRLADRMLAH